MAGSAQHCTADRHGWTARRRGAQRRAALPRLHVRFARKPAPVDRLGGMDRRRPLNAALLPPGAPASTGTSGLPRRHGHPWASALGGPTSAHPGTQEMLLRYLFNYTLVSIACQAFSKLPSGLVKYAGLRLSVPAVHSI
jgi:hypothetical protein